MMGGGGLTMDPEQYGEGYWEHGQGSNYVAYADDPGWVPTVEVLSEFVPVGSPPPTLLEVACAKGFFVRAARQRGYEAVGIDLSRWAVDHPAPGVAEFIRQGDAMELPWPMQSFDVVCSWEFLEHVPEPLLEWVLAEQVRVLRSGGLWVARIGTLESEEDRSQHLSDHTHVTNYPSSWWRDWLERGSTFSRAPEVEEAFDRTFADRDWAGRYFAYRVA